MAAADKSKGMKSAYELALERLEAQGIERPRDEALSEEAKRAIAEARKLTEAKLAELEILHRDKLRKLEDPAQRAEQEEFFRLEKARITAEGDARVARLRADAEPPDR
jgi:hypothetical protein